MKKYWYVNYSRKNIYEQYFFERSSDYNTEEEARDFIKTLQENKYIKVKSISLHYYEEVL